MNDRRNNFDALRILAAVMVLVSHGVPMTYGDNQHEILFRISHGQTSAGALSVDIFFAMSGYLVSGSYLRAGSAPSFIAARFLRIWPALAVAVVIQAVILGPWVASPPLADYFTSGDTWRFVWRNLLVREECCVPGVFAGNPIPGKLNYALWTLAYEADCYAIILCLGLLGLLRKYWILIAWLASLGASARWLGGALGPFAAVFMGGAVMRIWNPPLKGRVAAICALLWAIGLLLPGYRLFAATFGVYVVLFLALSPRIRLPALGRYGDLSYGTYIWAYPIQQCARMAMGPSGTWYWNAAAALPIALGFAALSWHFIEAPCLRLKPRSRVAAGVSPDVHPGVPVGVVLGVPSHDTAGDRQEARTGGSI